MRVIFDKYGKIVGTPTTDDYWGQGDNLTIFLEAQFLDDNEEPIVFSANQILEVVVERPDGQISPALLMSKVNDDQENLTIGKLTIDNWITEVAGKIKFNVRLKENINDIITTKVTGICYRIIGQAIDPADQTITDAEYNALMTAVNSKEDVANKSGTLAPNSTTKYPTHKLMHDYIRDRIILVDIAYESMKLLETDINRGLRSTFAYKGLYSVKVAGNISAYDRVLVLVDYEYVDYGYHATIFNGSDIRVINGTISTDTSSAGSLTNPKTSYRFDLTKIGLSNDGTLGGLSTTIKNSLVNAINEIVMFLGTTNPNDFSKDFDTPDSVLLCLNESRYYIRQIINGGQIVGKATHATNATNDEDGNQIKSTYAKLAASNLFVGDNEFSGFTFFHNGVIADDRAEFNDEIKIRHLTQTEGTATFNNVIIPLAVNNNNPARKDQLDQVKTDFITGAEVVSKATNDSSGNKINEFYAHSIEIISDDQQYTYTFQLKDASGTVLNQKTIDLPIESVVVSGQYDSANKKIVLTLENGSTIDIPVGDLISGLQTEITPQNKLASDLVDDTNQSNKFVSATEKAQITTNKENISALEARVDDYSYASMVYDAQDESIVVTGIALSYDGSDEELIIVR